MPFSQGDRASVEARAFWFYEHSSDGFAISKNGVILRTNQAWCDLLGVTREQAIGQTAQDIVKADDLPTFRASEVELRERGEIEYVGRLNSTSRQETWVEVSAKRGDDGLTLIIIRDVTARRKLAEEQQEVNNITALLRAHAGALMWQYSPEQELFFVDATRQPSTTLLQPISREVPLSEMLGRLDTDATRDAFLQALHHSIETGEQGQVEFRNTAVDGRREFHRAFWRGLRRQDDAAWRLIGMTQDITDLMDARDAALVGKKLAEDSDRVKARFLSNISHEFRTPLNGVLGVLRLLRNEPLQAPARKLLEEGVASAKLLHALLQDLVDLADLDAGRMALSLSVVDASSLVEGLIDLFKPEIEAKNLTIRADVPTHPLNVITDATRLRQIIASLIGNAAKFTLVGGVTIRMFATGDGDEHRLRIEVEDTGVGIARETMAELFSTFRQADDTATRRFGGIGMGLTLSRRLARLLGGEIGGSSELGRGSTFWVEVPAPLAAQNANPEEAAPFEGLRVLVVDDNATNRLVAEKILENFGAAIDTVEDGTLAVEAVKAKPFDLVLMDIQMPNMDGVEATLIIRALPAPLGQIPIAAMTANVSPEQVERYRAAGMDGVISKPVSPSTMFNEIVRLLAGEEQPNLYRLTYYSRPCPEVLAEAEKAISDILTVSYDRNRQHDISGALLFCETWFVQTLEGPQAAVTQLYDRIKADVRHERVTLMHSGFVGGRLFSEWTMIGMTRTGRELSESLNLGRFDPSALTEGEAVALLTSIAAVEQSEMLADVRALRA